MIVRDAETAAQNRSLAGMQKLCTEKQDDARE